MSTGPMTLSLRPLGAALRAAWRGAPVGFVGLLVLQAFNLGMFWLIAGSQRTAARQLTVGVVVGHSWAAAFIGCLAGLLIAARWLRQAKVVHGLRLPGGDQHMVRALLFGLGVTCALTALPPLGQVLLAMARGTASLAVPMTTPDGASTQVWALLLLALGLPVAGILGGAAYLLLGDSRWRRAGQALPALLIAFPWLLDRLVLPPTWVGPAVVAMSLLACAGGMSLWRALVRHVALPPAWSQGTALGGGSSLTGASRAGRGAAKFPVGLSAMVFPRPVSMKADLGFAVALTMVAAVMVGWASLRWGQGMLLVWCLMTNIVMPHIAGAWVSPRVAYLPGAPSRTSMQWFVLRQVLQRGLLRLGLAGAGLLALAAFTGAPAGDLLAAAVLMSAGAFWTASCAIAAPAWAGRAGGMGAAPWAALTALLAGLGWLLLRLPPNTPALAPVAMQTSVGALAAGCAVLLLSQRAWLHVDWARVPAQAWPNAEAQRAR